MIIKMHADIKLLNGEKLSGYLKTNVDGVTFLTWICEKFDCVYTDVESFVIGLEDYDDIEKYNIKITPLEDKEFKFEVVEIGSI